MSGNIDQEEITYIISHDLQEPVRMVSSYLKLLEKKYSDALDEDAKEYIRYAVDGANRMKQMLDDLLRYSRIRSENTQKTRIKIKPMVDETIRLLRKRYEGADFELVYDGDSDADVVADKGQIIQLFLNIFENSVKFNRSSDKKIHLALQREKNGLTICVWDNGIGIETQYHEKIFGVFKKLHNQNEYPGNGIGLAICRKIIDLYGGKIWVESESGKGTKFYVLFPN